MEKRINYITDDPPWGWTSRSDWENCNQPLLLKIPHLGLKLCRKTVTRNAKRVCSRPKFCPRTFFWKTQNWAKKWVPPPFESKLSSCSLGESVSWALQQIFRNFNERWFDAGGMCLGLANPARFTTKSRLTTHIAIIVGSATGLVTELLGAELLAILSFSEHWLRAGGLCLSLANSSCSVDNLGRRLRSSQLLDPPRAQSHNCSLTSPHEGEKYGF